MQPGARRQPGRGEESEEGETMHGWGGQDKQPQGQRDGAHWSRKQLRLHATRAENGFILLAATLHAGHGGFSGSYR